MKSMGLALTIFTITGVLVALDLSDASDARHTWINVARERTQSDAARAAATAPDTLIQQQADDEDEVDPGFRHAFLVTPTPNAPVRGVPALRYD